MHILPDAIGGYAADMDSLIAFIFYIIIPWFIVVEGTLLYFSFRYLRKPGVKAHYEAGTSKSALSWLLIPAAMILCFDLAIDHAGAKVWHEIKEQVPEKGTHVRVQAAQFTWKFIHPGPDNLFDTPDDVITDNTLHVPSGSPVIFELRSADVIHSFFIPNLRLKQDVVPGRSIKGWFQADKTGTYEIACAELCGLGHTKMRGWVQVHTPEEYQNWLSEQSKQKNTDDFWQ